MTQMTKPSAICAESEDDLYGFGAAAQKMIDDGTMDPLLIPSVLPDEVWSEYEDDQS